MKKVNRYKFAALDVIVRAIETEIENYERQIVSNSGYYANNDMELPDYVQKENARAQGIIDELNAFIERL